MKRIIEKIEFWRARSDIVSRSLLFAVSLPIMVGVGISVGVYYTVHAGVRAFRSDVDRLKGKVRR